MPSLSASARTQLASRVTGSLLFPGDAGYDDARSLWNGMFDRRPAVIVQPADTDSVAAAVTVAREHDLLLAVKGGGHNSAGTGACDDGMTIDLSALRSVTFDPALTVLRVGGGCLLSDVDRQTEKDGQAVPAGIISHTGVGGLTLGGGFGWISRKHGLTIDNLGAAEVVTADGRRVHASAADNPDLFWGLRGGGGNFGIVTEFEFTPKAIGSQVYSGLIVKRFDDAARYLAFQRDYVRTLPDDMTVWSVIRKAPPLPFLPEDVHGRLVVVVPFVCLSGEDTGASLIEPIRAATPSHGEMIGMHPWTVWQSLFDPLVSHGARNYWKSHHLRELSDSCIDQICTFAERFPSDECEVFIPHMEGAPARVPPDATAFAHRSTPFVMNIHTRWQDRNDDEGAMAWAREFHDRTRPFAQGVYVNFISDENADRVKDAYTPEVWQRLIALKTKWDPTNLFRVNQNIRPTGLPARDGAS
jgi:FAD/FMN-containing dehydrogenase